MRERRKREKNRRTDGRTDRGPLLDQEGTIRWERVEGEKALGGPCCEGVRDSSCRPMEEGQFIAWGKRKRDEGNLSLLLLSL